VTTKGLSGSLADFAKALYGGHSVAISASAAALKHRRRPKASRVTVTGSRGEWHGTPVAILSQGRDVTFALYRKGKWTAVAGWWPDLGVDGVSAGDKQFVLIMGSDARTSEGQSITRSRADTLQVIGVDGSGSAGVMGVPRDTWTDIGKINSAMVYGGPSKQVEAIATLTGLPIKHYVLTGFHGFRSFVHEIGGVTVTNPHAMPSRGIPKGRIHQGSNKALWFARERHSLPDGDFGRSADQQRLLMAFGQAMKRLGPTRFGKLVSTVSKVTTTDLPAENALQYAAWAWSIKPSKVGRVVATGGFGTRDGQSVVLLGSHARRIFKDFAKGRLST
jgi:LCP family protein required for cell wall assembly